MKIEMIVTDLDRTLLHNDKSMSQYSISILNTCREKGIKIAFATARPLRTIRNYLKQMEPDIVICHNGTEVYLDDKLLYTKRIQNSIAIEILQKIHKMYPNKKLSCEMNETNYANFDISLDYPGYFGIISDFTDLPDGDMDKILANIEGNPEHIEKIKDLLPDDLYLEIGDNKLAMIMNKKATKQAGIIAAAKELNIHKDNIIAFGDDYNDIGMIKYCGIGVAVANALGVVKAVADYMTLSNDEDGVAAFLEKHILHNGG